MSYVTTAHGLTMNWTVTPRTVVVNRANSYVIYGYINGECRMEHASSKGDFAHCERAVMARLAGIAKEKR